MTVELDRHPALFWRLAYSWDLNLPIIPVPLSCLEALTSDKNSASWNGRVPHAERRRLMLTTEDRSPNLPSLILALTKSDASGRWSARGRLSAGFPLSLPTQGTERLWISRHCSASILSFHLDGEGAGCRTTHGTHTVTSVASLSFHRCTANPYLY
jgi:hypothetical protein